MKNVQRKPQDQKPNTKSNEAAKGEVVFAPFFALQHQINELFEQTMRNFENLPMSGAAYWPEFDRAMPKIDVHEDRKGFRIKTRLPSDNPKDVDIEVSDNYLTVTCRYERDEERKSERGEQSLHSEGSYQRTVMLPETADTDKIDAEMKGPALIITIPKRQDIVNKARKVKVRKTH